MFENNQLTIALAYILVLLLCMSALAIFFIKRWFARDLYGRPNIVFYGLFGLMLVVDFVWSTLEYTGHRYRPVAFFANLFWYVAFLSICSRWFEICIRNLGAERLKSLIPRPVRLLPAVLVSLYIASSWWTGWTIGVTPEGCYVRGPYLWIAYATAYAYLIATISLCLVKGFLAQELPTRQFAFSLAMTTAPIFITAGLQYFTGFAFFFIGVIITVAVYDFDAQRKAMVILTAASQARHDAFTMVSHDIRTPLNAIIGLAELLQDEPSESERRRMQRAIITSSRTLMQLVNDVLDLAKLEAGKLDVQREPTNLAGLVESVLHVFADAAREKGLALAQDVPAQTLFVIDPQRIRQILFNLIGNAIKFTERGSITVRGRYRNGRLTLAVSDTGCGISPEDQKLLTNPYTQVGRLKGRVGTGLGLSICKRLVALTGGILTIESEVGRGSTFAVEVPCESRAQGEAPHQVKDEAPVTVPHRILMVDDAPLNLRVMSAMLKKLGQTDVTFAQDGDEALALLKADPDRFDLVLTDLQMPRMDGDELVRAIRADPQLARLPVHVITADIQARNDCRDVGFDSIVIKPVTIAKLAQVL